MLLPTEFSGYLILILTTVIRPFVSVFFHNSIGGKAATALPILFFIVITAARFSFSNPPVEH